jgi:hypothetical protein
MKKLSIVLGAAAMLFCAGQTTEAALVSCPASFTTDGTAKVTHDNSTDTAALGCQYISPADNNNVANETNVNAAGFFGSTNWDSTSVDQEGGAGYAGNSGSWAIAAPDFATYDYIIVFKDGADTNLIAFLLNEEVSFGDWTTPFTEPPFDFSGGSTSHGVSHVSIFQTTDDIPDVPDPVAEPTTMVLLGMGLLGAGFARRRR